MQEISELMPMFSYSLITILFFLLLVITNIILLIKPKKIITTENNPIIIEPPKNSKDTIKNQYLKEIDLLKIKLQNNEITSRKAYQRLSIIIRKFIYEMTSLKVQNYTLEEIKQIKMPVLIDLVGEYYDPEFSVNEKGNIENSIEKTREVISRWI